MISDFCINKPLSKKSVLKLSLTRIGLRIPHKYAVFLLPMMICGQICGQTRLKAIPEPQYYYNHKQQIKQSNLA